MNRLERLFAVSEELRRRSPASVSARDLAERFGVSRRTIERDLASLRAAGLPTYSASGRDGGTGVLTNGNRLMLAFSAAEAVGLLLATRMAADAPFSEQAEQASGRIYGALGPDARRLADDLGARVVVRPGPGGTPEMVSVRRTLEEAVRASLVVNLVYRDSSGAESLRPVEAVGLYRGADQWYLIGWCRLRRDRRLFRLDRIVSANPTAERFAARDPVATLGWVPS